MSWIREQRTEYSWWQCLALKVLQCGPLPRHVAFIMDGNRRFAKRKGLEKLDGHAQGFDKLAETLQWCHDLGIKEVTVYAFSIENFKRPSSEVQGLLDLAKAKFQRLLEEEQRLKEHGVRVNVIGNLDLLPPDMAELVKRSTEVTKLNERCTLNVAFSYTARDEVAASIRTLASAVSDGLLESDDISEGLIERCLYTRLSPTPDLLVRTSGEVRLSDFLLWQSSYSVTYFADVLWPEFSLLNLMAAIFYYQRHQRYIRRPQQGLLNTTSAKCDHEKETRIAEYLDNIDNVKHLKDEKTL